MGKNHSWGFGLAIVTTRDDVSSIPGRYGWDGGLVDFWTWAYQAIED